MTIGPAFLWYVILFGLLGLYLIFDAYELGAGMAYGLFADKDDEKAKILKSIRSVWDANEIWLLSFFALAYLIFPEFFRTVLKTLKDFIFLFVFLYILLAVSQNLLRIFFDKPYRKILEWLYVSSSFLLTGILGLFLAQLIRGFNPASVPVLAPYLSPFAGNPAYIDWFSISFTLLFMVIILLNGLGWIVHRVSGAFGRKLKFKIQKLAVTGIVLVLAVFILYFFINKSSFEYFIAYPAWIIFPVLMIGSFAGLVMVRTYQKDNKGLLLATNLLIYFWIALMILQYPYLIHSTPSFSGINIYHTEFHALEDYHIQWWTIAVTILLLIYSVLVHKFSKGHALFSAKEKA